MKDNLLNAWEELAPDTRLFIGNDLVHVPTFALSLSDEFKNKVFTPQELAYCNQFSAPLLRYASTWAAKEAVYKALKQAYPHHPLSWKNIEIIRHKPAGRPCIQLHNCFYSFSPISLTISHDGDYAWAAALISPQPAHDPA